MKVLNATGAARRNDSRTKEQQVADLTAKVDRLAAQEPPTPEQIKAEVQRQVEPLMKRADALRSERQGHTSLATHTARRDEYIPPDGDADDDPERLTVERAGSVDYLGAPKPKRSTRKASTALPDGTARKYQLPE